MEDLLFKHKQQIINLEAINYDCYRFIGLLLSLKDKPQEEDAKQLNLKRFLLSKNIGHGMKKIFNTESATS